MEIKGTDRAVESRHTGCHAKDVTIQDKGIEAGKDLPDDASFEDAMERRRLLAKIEGGIQQADSGQTVSHAKVKQRMARWHK